MNAKQKNKFAMELALRDFLNQNATITSPLPNFAALFSSFSENMDTIRQISEQQETDRTGITRSKEQIKNDLINSTLDVSDKLTAYAKMTENTVLEGEVWSSKSTLRKSHGSLLANRALSLYDKAAELREALAAYGITSEGLTAFKNAIDRYNEILPKPRLGITEKKQATNHLGQLFAANDRLLEKLDALVKIVRTAQPAFYKAWTDNRRVIATGTGTLALLARITDAVTREGLRGVLVRLTHLNGNLNPVAARFGAVVEKTSGEKGIFRSEEGKELSSGITAVGNGRMRAAEARDCPLPRRWRAAGKRAGVVGPAREPAPCQASFTAVPLTDTIIMPLASPSTA